MKRVQSACILQTLVFQQKEESGFSQEEKLELNREEVRKYKESLDKNKTRYQIDEETEKADGAVVVRIRKQYNDTADVSAYFDK